MQFYITAWDEVTGPLFDACVAAVDRGVVVRLLFDHLGSRGIPGYKEMVRRLDASGIEWRPMLPVSLFALRFRRPDLRNHRKLLVVDGQIGFMGSQNMTEPGYNKPKNHAVGREWVELMVQVRGPIVAALEGVFGGDWYAETGETLSVQANEASTEIGRNGEPAHGVTAQLVPSGPGYPA